MIPHHTFSKLMKWLQLILSWRPWAGNSNNELQWCWRESGLSLITGARISHQHQCQILTQTTIIFTSKPSPSCKNHGVMLFIGLRPHGSGPVYLWGKTCQRLSVTNYGRVSRKQRAFKSLCYWYWYPFKIHDPISQLERLKCQAWIGLSFFNSIRK